MLPWLADDYSLLLGLPGQILPGIEYRARCTMATLEEEGGCRFVETLPDDGLCPHDITQTVGRPCWPGWHRDLGLDDEGHRRCEILPSDRDGDGAPDVMEGYPESRCSIAEGALDTRGCQPGWFYSTVMLQQSTSDLPTILFTVGCVEGMMSPRAWLTLECDEDCKPWDVSLE